MNTSRGTDSPYRMHVPLLKSYLLWPSVCRPLSTYAYVDTCQLPIPLSIAGWNDWLTCRPPVVDVTARTPTYFSTGYCSGDGNEDNEDGVSSGGSDGDNNSG